MALINFTLTEHLLEDKINTAAQNIIQKTENRMQSELMKKTKDLRKYMELELKKS